MTRDGSGRIAGGEEPFDRAKELSGARSPEAREPERLKRAEALGAQGAQR